MFSALRSCFALPFLCFGLSCLSAMAPAATPEAETGEPRVLILSLDGVSYRVVERARELGAFRGWPRTTRLVSTFPSMTNVAFTAILTPFGVEPIRGYEMRHYDADRNRVVGGGPIGYKKKSFAWKKLYHVISHTNLEKSAAFIHPRKNARSVMHQAEELVLGSDDELILAHIESTDVLAHFRGDEPVLEIVVEVADWADELLRRHEESFGRPLTIVLFSDHGNTDGKVHNIGGIYRRLRQAGLNPVTRLEQPRDVVAPTYGVVGFGVLYTDPEFVETAARAVSTHPRVDLTAWIDGADLRVISRDSSAVLQWRDGPAGRRYRYLPEEGDPLRLAPAMLVLSEAFAFDSDGFASEEDWFDASALSDYPDAPRRLVESLTGTFVSNPATVIFSLAQGAAWGRKPAQAAAQLLGGDLEGTHGGLDRASSEGFFLSNDAGAHAGRPAVTAVEALEPWAPAAYREDETTFTVRDEGGQEAPGSPREAADGS